MDYTTKARVKLEAIKTSSTTDDTLMDALITSASRAIDRRVTGTVEGDNYFELEDITDELLNGVVDKQGNIVCAPHKPIVNSVASLSYRWNPTLDWTTAATANLVADNQFAIAWLEGAFGVNTRPLTVPGKVFVKISYNGGIAATVADLPGDIVELATLLTARLYREAESGLADVIGVAEIGQLMYTKAWPVRFVEMLRPYERRVGWSKLG